MNGKLQILNENRYRLNFVCDNLCIKFSYAYEILISCFLSVCFKYRDMIKKHYPWGRPGGGAPNEHIRIGDLTTRGIYPDSRSNVFYYLK